MTLETIIGISPFESPDVALVAALARAGALGVLDLGHDADAARAALAEAARRLGRFGVRVPEHSAAAALELPAAARVVVLPASLLPLAARWRGRTLLVQARSAEEIAAALAAGVDGVIVKGHEAGGQVGDETTFVLLQRALARAGCPIWAQGGIGLHTAAAARAGGAHGVVLDSQLALTAEAATTPALKRVLAAMDGSETVIAASYRLYARPNARAPEPGADAAAVAHQLGAGDPARELVTLGQDAAFAAPLGQRYGSVARVVGAVATAIDGHLRQARALQPLARRAPFARRYGVELPIAQGPMTRVSDRAAFAAAVAAGGALPFLALSLARGAEARALLDETRALLGERPWGVGILGFVPPELREEQLALVTELRPRVAIIAGGRPSQAQPLEAAGVATFLHVPSPGLLDLFLNEGARRFVFEGRECGGHVGPRASFVLWESAVERLLACERLGDVSVLFAGGIHDAVSARMVAALAAPLAARGAAVGVLMGTAYLFTEEAVSAGAIGPAFQAAALGCARTALVETAPGHATRCADSEFVHAFARERARLEAAGSGAEATWAALEQLNLGRLRLAAKGLRRDGEALVTVSEDEQRQEGMFMIGQVAALRSARCTVAELHRQVSDEATASLAASAAREERVAAPAAPEIVTSRSAQGGLDVAIVGMACVFPDAPDLDAFWSHVLYGRNAIREVPAWRWDPAVFYAPDGTGERTPSKWGGFVPATLFDPGRYGIPPRALASIDPAQLLALEVARRALDDAGYDRRPLDGERASVIFGAESGTELAQAYGFRASFPRWCGPLPAALDAALPRLSEDSFPGILANVIAGRIANRLDLRGVNYTVDAACASSLAAVDLACKELRGGASDLVVAGGADLHNDIQDYLLFASVHALSPRGQSRPFDAGADGIALGEGVAALVLKRREDAERDGDRIYAVIAGVGGSSDGKSLGLTAPRKEGQLRALERAYTASGLSPADVGLVEAHGTGTVVGDRTELAALSELYWAAGAPARGCTLGSVKSLIGHTKCAAGLAGLIKATLALHHGVLPPTKNITAPNPGYDEETSPFVLRAQAAPWSAPERVAAVSAFGFGGTNFHAVLTATATATAPTLKQWPAELFVLRGDDAAVARLGTALDDAAAGSAPPSLRDLAAAAAGANVDGPVAAALVAGSLAELRAGLAALRAGATAPGLYRAAPVDGSVAFLFPGQGSQRPGMLSELFVLFPELRDLVELARPWHDRLFPPGAYGPAAEKAQRQAITDTLVAQPTLGLADLAIARLLARVGVTPAMAAGHSYGELAALAAAGVCDAATLVALSTARARAIRDAAGAEPGAMAAVRADAARVRELVGDGADPVLANHNAPDQVVLSGSRAAVTAACATLEAHGVAAKLIPVACAFHSPLVAAAAAPFAAVLNGVALAAPAFPVYANVDARPYAGDAAAIRRTLAAQIARPVRFVDVIEAMYAAGARVFVEVGPGQVLGDLAARILRGRPHAVIACDHAERGGVATWLDALARLLAAGVAVDVAPLFAGRARAVDLERPQAFTAPATAWLVDGGGARPIAAGEPAPRQPVPLALAAAAPSAAANEEQAVREYLGAMRELVAAQREVMLRFLDRGANGIAPTAASVVATAAAANGPAAASVPAAAANAPAATAPRALDVLVATVSERTGYPPDMLDLDLDLEADLGVDSIKRVEILGEMRHKLGLAASGGDALVEKLAAVKTLRGIAALLDPASAATPANASDAAVADVAPASVTRYVVEVATLPPATAVAAALAGQRFGIVADARGVAPELAALLAGHGASARVVAADEPLGDVDGLVYLATLTADSPAAARALFTHAQAATRSGARAIVAATGLGGRFGHHRHRRGDGALGGAAGVSGFLKSLAKEHAALHVRAVDLDPDEAPARLAAHLAAELGATGGPVEVGWAEGARYHTRVVAEHAPATGTPAPLELDERSVVLLTGGARGITAQVALAMARRFRCAIELVGRSPLPAADEDDAELHAAADLPSLRRLLAGRANGAGASGPQAIDALARRLLAGREIRATLAAITSAGARVDYHAVDVRDQVAFPALLDRLHARHGRIDGAVHGAGLIEDNFLRDKTHESFDRVFFTKVDGARMLAHKLAPTARFLVFFSSVSGAFGNRGQTDYAAANDALDKLAHRLHRTVPARVLSINWGPWRGVGMVRPELEREYERRGIALIAPEAGVARFFEELLGGGEPQVILTAAPAEVLA